MKNPATGLSIRTRFTVGVGLMLLPLVILAVAGYFYFTSALASFDFVMKEVFRGILPLHHLQQFVIESAMPPNDYLIRGGADERDLFAIKSARVDSAFEEINFLSGRSEKYRTLIDQAKRKWSEGKARGEVLVALPFPIRDPRAGEKMEAFDSSLSEVSEVLDRLHVMVSEELDNAHAHALSLQRNVNVLIFLTFAIGIAAAVLSIIMLSKQILHPLLLLKEGASRFGSGNLQHRIEVHTQDEIGQLAATFNTMADELEQLAIRDALTGLYNKREFQRRLDQEITRARRYKHNLSLLIIDIDHFKQVNDTFGHQTGDKVLQILCGLIQKQMRPTDSTSRYGGEELALILPETDETDASRTAERLRELIESYTIDAGEGTKLRLTISIGLATFPADGATDLAFVAAADQALYAAKRKGRNRVCRYSEL